jgi:hypothetical protein
MSQSEKSEERKEKTDPKQALDLEELGAVNGGEFMFMATGGGSKGGSGGGSDACCDRGTYKCTGNPYNCRSTDDTKRFCSFG